MDPAATGAILRPPSASVDIIIVGGGLAGTLAATLLGRRGLTIALIDLHDIYPPDFRAEQLVGSQVEALSRLGLLESVVGNAAPVGQAVATLAGRTIDVAVAPHYGIRYESMVNRARRHLPPLVQLIAGRVVDLEITSGRQRATLLSGDVVEGHLVLMATGFGQRLLRQLGIGKQTIRKAHSLTFGFDLGVASPAAFQRSVLVAYGERTEARIDYLTVFAIADKLRANLFTYGQLADPWSKKFIQRPVAALRQALPSVEQITGHIQAAGPVEVRVNDLTTTTGHCRDGVVLIGDAFQTSCPAAGTGISRLLNDIDVLCNVYIPKWFATPGMDVGKIAAFYKDPIKRCYDAEAVRVANYRRAVTTESSLSWKLHRHRVWLQNRVRLALGRRQRAYQINAHHSAETEWPNTSIEELLSASRARSP